LKEVFYYDIFLNRRGCSMNNLKKDVLMRHCEKLMRIVELKLLIRILKKGVS
jgi:hypothetical protein